MDFNILIFATILVASFVQTVAGFAFAIITMAIWPLIMPVVEATQLMSFGSITCILFVFLRHRRHVNYRISVVPIVIGLAGTVVGLTLLVNLRNEVVLKIIGAMLVVLAIYLFFFSGRVQVRPNLLTASAAGIVGGVMGGLFNIAGPAMVLYYTVATKSKEEYIGTLQFFFVIIIVVKFVLLWILRGLSPFVVGNAPSVVIASVVGMLLGSWLFDAISGVLLKRIVLILMVISGIWYILR